MQSLWNRASQAHRCGCRACSTAVNAIGRRATTGAGRRKATFAEIVTACYSSMFASAAIIDSMRKDERRKELDQQLNEARQELADLKEQGKSLPSRSGTSADRLSAKQMDILWTAMKQVYNERPYRKNILYPPTVPASGLISTLRSNYYDCPPASHLKKGYRIDYAALEQAIMDESDSYMAPGARTETQLRHETTRFLCMVRELLNTAGQVDRKTASPSFKEARDLLNSSHTSYTFRSINPVAAQETTKALNESVRQVLASRLPLKEKIGRLCYNMLVSSYVPDVHTYNTLIAAFDKRGYFDLSEAVIYSFFYGRYIRPTESTFVAILNHNKLMNRPGRFLLNIARITGLDANVGAKIRLRHQDSLQRNFERRWAKTNPESKTQTGDYIVEHMPLNLALVEEMMRGLLRFQLFEQAAVLFIGCLQSGVALGSRVVRQLLDECILALDWSAGVRIIRGMGEFGQQWRELIVESGEDSMYLISRVHVLLDLCGVDTRGEVSSSAAARLRISKQQLSSFLDSLNGLSIVSDPSGITQKRNPNKSRLLQVEALWKEYIRVRKTTTSIESKLLNSDHAQEFREDCAIHIGESALERSAKLSEEFASFLRTLRRRKREEEQVDKRVTAAEEPHLSYGPRIAMVQSSGPDCDLTMHWTKRMSSRLRLVARSLGFGSV